MNIRIAVGAVNIFVTAYFFVRLLGVPDAFGRRIAGNTQVLFVDIGPSIELVRAGKAVALGITSAEPAAAAAEVPPLARVGVPGFDTTAWQMIVAPARTPRPILSRLNAEINDIVRTDEISKQFIGLGLIPIGKGSLEELAAFVKSESARWGKVIREANLAGTQ